MPRYIRGGHTAIGDALAFALIQLNTNAYVGLHRAIDLSGDGRSNDGRALAPARSDVLDQGITINGLAILNELPLLEGYFQSQLIGGNNAFVMSATDYRDFARAIREKLEREIRSAPIVRNDRLAPLSGTKNGLCIRRAQNVEPIASDSRNELNDVRRRVLQKISSHIPTGGMARRCVRWSSFSYPRQRTWSSSAAATQACMLLFKLRVMACRRWCSTPERLVFGCSTRNGGQISTCIKPSYDELRTRYGSGTAEDILKEGQASLDHVEQFVVEEKIDCNFKVCGRFHGAHTARNYDRLARECDTGNAILKN